MDQRVNPLQLPRAVKSGAEFVSQGRMAACIQNGDDGNRQRDCREKRENGVELGRDRQSSKFHGKTIQ
jgi:hypothetical protein